MEKIKPKNLTIRIARVCNSIYKIIRYWRNVIEKRYIHIVVFNYYNIKLTYHLNLQL